MRWMVLLAAVPLAAQPAGECDRDPMLSPEGIGPLRIGITADSLARVCRVVGTTRMPEYILHRVRVGSDTVRAFERAGRIDWIEVDSPRLRTRDSLGVGSPAARLLGLPDVAGGPGDGPDAFTLQPRSGPNCGLAFWLDSQTATMLNASKGDRLRLLEMRGSGVVTQVDIRGECKTRQ